MNNTNVFSDSWYKISNQKVALLDSVSVVKQRFRDEDTYLLKESYNNKYFKLSKEGYRFVSNLSLDKSVQEVLDEIVEQKPNEAPSQDEIIELISSLHEQNLLCFKNMVHNDFIHQRKKDKKYKENKSKIYSFLFFKIPLFNPNKILNRYQNIINIIVTKKILFLWFLFAIYAIILAIENFTLIKDQAQGFLSPSNIILLYIAIAIMKFFHEIAHSIVIKRYGGSVNTIGIMFLVFTPLPYMDATHSWFFGDKYKKMAVSSAGMISDIFFASLSTIIWANTADGTIHSVAFNIMILGSVSSILFNGNPLLKFDAYYLVSDYLEIPNLFTKSKDYIFYLAQKYIFKIENLVSNATSQNEANWLIGYGVFSYIYRLFISLGIILYVSDQLFILGVVIAIMSIMMWVVLPLKNFLVFLFKSQKLYKNRDRAILISFSIFFIITIIVFFLPLSYNIKATGVVLANNVNIYTKSGGLVKDVYIKNGSSVKEGDIIAVLENKDLILDIKNTKLQLSQIENVKQKVMSASIEQIKTLNENKDVLQKKLKYLENRQKELIIRAKSSGVFVTDVLDTLIYTYIKPKTHLGKIITNDDRYFYAVLPQERAYELFSKKRVVDSSIKFFGQSEKEFRLDNTTIVPYAKDKLPSSALGWLGGGDISVSSDDNEGKKTNELFFEISGKIVANNDMYILKDGRTGVIRIELEKTPLAQQIYIKIVQLLQKRYKI